MMQIKYAFCQENANANPNSAIAVWSWESKKAKMAVSWRDDVSLSVLCQSEWY